MKKLCWTIERVLLRDEEVFGEPSEKESYIFLVAFSVEEGRDKCLTVADDLYKDSPNWIWRITQQGQGDHSTYKWEPAHYTKNFEECDEFGKTYLEQRDSLMHRANWSLTKEEKRLRSIENRLSKLELSVNGVWK